MVRRSALRRLLTPYDLALAAAILVAALVSFYFVGFAAAADAGVLQVQIEGRVVTEVTFRKTDPPRLIKVNAPRGLITIELRDGRARVLPLSTEVCPLAICWNSGWTGHPAKAIVCLPNRLVLRVLTSPGGVDGITR
jgi:hypothetical protein